MGEMNQQASPGYIGMRSWQEDVVKRLDKLRLKVNASDGKTEVAARQDREMVEEFIRSCETAHNRLVELRLHWRACKENGSPEPLVDALSHAVWSQTMEVCEKARKADEMLADLGHPDGTPAERKERERVRGEDRARRLKEEREDWMRRNGDRVRAIGDRFERILRAHASELLAELPGDYVLTLSRASARTGHLYVSVGRTRDGSLAVKRQCYPGIFDLPVATATDDGCDDPTVIGG